MADERYILVIADNSSEMKIALEYACARSKTTGRKIIIATFVEPIDVLNITFGFQLHSVITWNLSKWLTSESIALNKKSNLG